MLVYDENELMNYLHSRTKAFFEMRDFICIDSYDINNNKLLKFNVFTKNIPTVKKVEDLLRTFFEERKDLNISVLSRGI